MSAAQRHNNFDLIRLLAAAQVVLVHAIRHTDLHNHLPWWGWLVFEALLSWCCFEKPALACESISPRAIWRRLTGTDGNKA